MKVFYVGKGSSGISQLKSVEKTFIALGWDKWDDYSFKTLLPCHLVVNGEEIEISNIRILIKGSDFTAATLDELASGAWNREFPIPGHEYISVPSDVNFYEIIQAKTSLAEAAAVAQIFHDASYLKNIEKRQDIDELIKSKAFENSLLREGGSRKAFLDGYRIFQSDMPSTIGDFQLNIPVENQSPVEVSFKFNSKTLPYDINVLIGPNGIGKSYCLQLLAEYWLRINRGAPGEIGDFRAFDSYPNIGKLILISYSPFEDFIIDLAETNLEDKEVYKYFGFRRKTDDDSGGQRIGISRNLPSSDSSKSILKCIEEDDEFSFLPSWVNKFTSAKTVLSGAIDFDSMALTLTPAIDGNFSKISLFGSDISPYVLQHEGKSYLKLNEASIRALDLDEVGKAVEFSDGVIFIKSDLPVPLSSGQRLFSYMVVNLLGALKNNSLVVIDEPELFLHPNLEITFIGLLKMVLEKFKSKAILATHSLVSTREVPARCVHVFRKTEAGKQVVHPPFETFGGDIQRISTYVFGDKSVSKPYVEWLRKKIAEHSTPDDFIAALGDEINEELFMQIKKIAGEI